MNRVLLDPALLVLGLATRVAAAATAVVSVGAIAIVHWSAGSYAAGGGYELVLVLAAMAVTLVLTAAGAWSLDAPFARRRSAEPAREMVSA
ncbi:DoxX family membrane protein [Janibacter melonis]|uniref:DoxX family membrane protein n=1 Tax=Janibacter melonis TaxID=262209 RepID=UPI0020448F11|nr:TQO small subunit DoxD [Janibacter melonis]MCM3553915.1 DoxX family membrane protein [Janibacter melonis]